MRPLQTEYVVEGKDLSIKFCDSLFQNKKV